MAEDNQEQAPERKPSLLQVFQSAFAAALGVQSQAKRERDFGHGSPGQFIIVGLVFTVVFILVLWGVVKLVMALAGV
jgi:hypothetical protein